MTLSLHDFQAIPGGEANMEKLWDEEFRHYLPGIRDDDFIGVQNYTRELVGPEGSVTVPDGADITQCGYEFYPEGLEHVAVDMAAGEFLLSKKTFAPADIAGLDLNYAVKQIQTGDTNTVFATGEGSATPEQRLTNFVNYLLSRGRDEFSSFRRLRW